MTVVLNVKERLNTASTCASTGDVGLGAGEALDQHMRFVLDLGMGSSRH